MTCLEGFLNLNFLDKNFDKSNGLFDQMAALKFIRNNIHRFGGDADNVTVFGQSAGAACILALLGMPEAKLLFDKAILMSPCAKSFWTEQQSERLTRKYLGFLEVKENELYKLKDLPIWKIHEANTMTGEKAQFELPSRNTNSRSFLFASWIFQIGRSCQRVQKAGHYRNMRSGR